MGSLCYNGHVRENDRGRFFPLGGDNGDSNRNLVRHLRQVLGLWDGSAVDLHPSVLCSRITRPDLGPYDSHGSAGADRKGV